MRAKEMAAILLAAKSEEELNEAVNTVFKQALHDMLETVRIRKITRADAKLSVIKEADQKWRAMCRMAPGICKPHGLRGVLFKDFPVEALQIFGEPVPST